MSINMNNYLDVDGNYDLKKALVDEVVDEVNTHLADNVSQGNPHGIDAKANKQQENWADLVLQNSWTNIGLPFFYAGYMKDQLGFVHLRGVITGGTLPGGVVALTNLPIGYRPNKESIFIVSSYSDGDVIGRIHILSNGEVQLYTGGNGHVSLDGITFQSA